MCIAHPAKITEINNDVFICDFLGLTEECRGDFCKNAKIGDYVLIHGGYAIQIMNEKEADESLEIFKELSEIQ